MAVRFEDEQLPSAESRETSTSTITGFDLPLFGFLRGDGRRSRDERDFYDLTSDGDTTNNDMLHPGRTVRSSSVGSGTNKELAAPAPSSISTPTSPARRTAAPMAVAPGMAMFDGTAKALREAPPKPTTDGIDYVRAASWAAGSCSNCLADDRGRQLFRCFLFDSLADENLSFLEAVEKLKKMKIGDEKKEFAREIISQYAPYINLSDNAMKKIKAAADSEGPIDSEDFAPAIKEIRRLLENDQFPRFKRSEIYLAYLEELLPRTYAEKWTTSFEALLGNHVGRHHFRLFLRSIRAEENLRFWESVVEFRATKNKSPAMYSMAQSILKTYLAEGCVNEVFLPFGVRQMIERRIEEKEVDISVFEEAIKHVEQVLRNDPYVRFLQSPQYLNLLSKLKRIN